MRLWLWSSCLPVSLIPESHVGFGGTSVGHGWTSLGHTQRGLILQDLRGFFAWKQWSVIWRDRGHEDSGWREAVRC